MTVLGFAHVPFHANLAIVLAAGALFSAHALRTRGAPPAPDRPSATLLPLYVAVLLAAVALVPMFRSGFATVIGNGSDAHLAVGTAQFLQHHAPLDIAPEEPVDRVPLVWRSKQPIYYALGGVASLSGLESYETIAAVAAIMLALAALGWYLLARYLLKTGPLAAIAAMAVAGLDKMVLHTGMHPYFNQTWGYFTMPFALLLAWTVVERPSRATGALLALFLAVGAFAYPLALPIPVLALWLFWSRDRRLRREAGEDVETVRHAATRIWDRLWHGPRSLVWMIPLGLLLSVPVAGVLEKAGSAIKPALDPTRSLQAWGGDLLSYFPTWQFVSLSSPRAWHLVYAVIFAFVIAGLWVVDRRIAWGLGGVILFGAVAARWFEARDFGWYFHFKVLAFVGPLIVVTAVAGAARLRYLGALLIALFVVSAQASARSEVNTTFDQLQPAYIELRGWAEDLPAGASVRLDIDGPRQLWAGYMLARQPLCAQRPLLQTSYPHVPISRRADYVLAERRLQPPFDSAGAPLHANDLFALYRMRPGVRGPGTCSRQMVQTVTGISRD
jgi:hypothetical protein